MVVYLLCVIRLLDALRLKPEFWFNKSFPLKVSLTASALKKDLVILALIIVWRKSVSKDCVAALYSYWPSLVIWNLPGRNTFI